MVLRPLLTLPWVGLGLLAPPLSSEAAPKGCSGPGLRGTGQGVWNAPLPSPPCGWYPQRPLRGAREPLYNLNSEPSPILCPLPALTQEVSLGGSGRCCSGSGDTWLLWAWELVPGSALDTPREGLAPSLPVPQHQSLPGAGWGALLCGRAPT